jgi:hypothetical protein
MSDTENKVTNPDGTTTVTQPDGSTQTYDADGNEIHSTPPTDQQQTSGDQASSTEPKETGVPASDAQVQNKDVQEEANAAEVNGDKLVVDNLQYSTQLLSGGGGSAVTAHPAQAQQAHQTAIASEPVAPYGFPKPVAPQTAAPTLIGAAAVPATSLQQTYPVSQPKALMAAVPTHRTNPAPAPVSGMAPVVGGVPVKPPTPGTNTATSIIP